MGSHCAQFSEFTATQSDITLCNIQYCNGGSRTYARQWIKEIHPYYKKDVPWATDHNNICFQAVRVLAFSKFDQLVDLVKSLINAISAWHRTSTTKHPQQYTCKILLALHLSVLAKSPGQRSLETNKHTQSHKQTRWKHYSVTFASGWKHYLLTITDDNELHWVIWDRLKAALLVHP